MEPVEESPPGGTNKNLGLQGKSESHSQEGREGDQTQVSLHWAAVSLCSF